MARLQAHDWPGNLHEMRSLVGALNGLNIQIEAYPELKANET